jgi:hypothetical protein
MRTIGCDLHARRQTLANCALCEPCKILSHPHFHSGFPRRPLYTLLKNKYSTSAVKLNQKTTS